MSFSLVSCLSKTLMIQKKQRRSSRLNLPNSLAKVKKVPLKDVIYFSQCKLKFIEMAFIIMIIKFTRIKTLDKTNAGDTKEPLYTSNFVQTILTPFLGIDAKDKVILLG